MPIIKSIGKILQRLLFQNYKLSLIDKDSLKEKQVSDFYGYHILSIIAYLFLTAFIFSFFLEIQISCFGQPKPTNIICGLISFILFSIS